MSSCGEDDGSGKRVGGLDGSTEVSTEVDDRAEYDVDDVRADEGTVCDDEDVEAGVVGDNVDDGGEEGEAERDVLEDKGADVEEDDVGLDVDARDADDSDADDDEGDDAERERFRTEDNGDADEGGELDGRRVSEATSFGNAATNGQAYDFELTWPHQDVPLKHTVFSMIGSITTTDNRRVIVPVSGTVEVRPGHPSEVNYRHNHILSSPCRIRAAGKVVTSVRTELTVIGFINAYGSED
ncbi:unnamed protein product [Tilletia caries]|nr:unnamed protein product [Tilletia caries]